MKQVFQDPLPVHLHSYSYESKASLKPVGQGCFLVQLYSERAECLVTAKPRIICFSFLTRTDCVILVEYLDIN